jgi:hypothetical protein
LDAPRLRRQLLGLSPERQITADGICVYSGRVRYRSLRIAIHGKIWKQGAHVTPAMRRSKALRIELMVLSRNVRPDFATPATSGQVLCLPVSFDPLRSTHHAAAIMTDPHDHEVRASEQPWQSSEYREVAERQGFEPWIPCGIHAFQACAFSHSAISPHGVGLTAIYHIAEAGPATRDVSDRTGFSGERVN